VSKKVVDIDGDEMTRVIWAWIKEKVNFDFNFTKLLTVAYFPLRRS